MLAKKYRLPIQDWFGSNKVKEKFVKTDYFILKKRENNLGYSRLGVIISYKDFKKAVKRNQLKRIVFNFFRENNYQNKLKGDFLLIVKKEINSLLKEEILKELEKIFKKLC